MNIQTVILQSRAPPKPEPGEACNGCGICCAAETCPAGRLIFWKRKGPCPALEWHDAAGIYRCGLLVTPSRYLKVLPDWTSAWAKRAFTRWIAAGQSCDSWVEDISRATPAPSGKKQN